MDVNAVDSFTVQNFKAPTVPVISAPGLELFSLCDRKVSPYLLIASNGIRFTIFSFDCRRRTRPIGSIFGFLYRKLLRVTCGYTSPRRARLNAVSLRTDRKHFARHRYTVRTYTGLVNTNTRTLRLPLLLPP